jgi:GT2 family glycosyltransferase
VGGVSARVTVVMATLGRRDQVLTTLGHLSRLPERPPVVLVDNGSTDGTAEAVEQHYPDVTVLRPGRNLGATGRTLGVQAARTDLVAFADDDSWWAPGALQRATEHFDRWPRLGLLAARILVGPRQLVDPVCDVMAASPLPRCEDLPGPSVLGFIACGAVVRRQAYLQVGGFSPVLFFLGEETVLSQDLAAAGWGLAYVDDVVAHHHPVAGPERSGRRRLQTRNALLTTWLRRPLPVVLHHTGAVARGASDPVRRGALLDAARRLPAVVADRRLLPVEVERHVRLLEAGDAREPAGG